MANRKILDIDKLDNRIRDKVVLSAFDKLRKGEQITILASYDPLTIKKKFDKTRPGYFRWNYIKKDSLNQEIRITKHGSSRLTVNEIIRLYPGAISVFEKHQIAYYLKGNQYLSNISKLRGIKENKLIAEIVSTSGASYPELRFHEWDIPLIINYIISNHHTYLKETLKEIGVLIDHVAAIHIVNRREIVQVKTKFNEISNELMKHLKEEEETVFPEIQKFYTAKKSNGTANDEAKMKYSINWLKEDHIITATDLKCLRDLCNNYIPPANACPAFCLLYEEMLRFEKDQHFHIYLENNILFSAAKKLLNGSITRTE